MVNSASDFLISFLSDHTSAQSAKEGCIPKPPPLLAFRTLV